MIKELTKASLRQLLGEIGFDIRENYQGELWAVKYADEMFPHNVVYTFSVDRDWLHVTGCAKGFAPAAGEEYAVLEVLNLMNKKRVDPIGFYLNSQPQFRHSTRLGQEMSEEFIKRNGIRFGAYCIHRCFVELYIILRSRGINTISPF